MAEHIDRAKLLERIDKALFESPEDGDEQIGILKCRRIIRECPEAEVAERKVCCECRRKDSGEAHWLSTRDPDKKECSACGVIHKIMQYPFGRADFCPNCGKKMSEEHVGNVIESMKRAGDSAKNVTESLKNVTESLKNVIDAFENADRCVCCGDIVPEGRQVCPGCETGGNLDG